MFARDRKTPIAEWWWTIDKQLLSALILLMAVGMVLSFAASPPVAERLGLSPWHFIIRHAMFDLLALPVLIGTSFLTHRQARFAALGGAGGLDRPALADAEARRRGQGRASAGSRFAGNTIQPSEFVKPAYAVIARVAVLREHAAEGHACRASSRR